MEEETALVPVEEKRVQLGMLQADGPQALVVGATGIADTLANVIKEQKLYAYISNKKYVTVEGWTTLAALMGCTPHEIAVLELEDGSFEATIELRRIDDGKPISRASSICGMDERRWGNADRYARRSMAQTRATGKACRLAFSWIMQMSGFPVTPAEEMPGHEGAIETPTSHLSVATPRDSAPHHDIESDPAPEPSKEVTPPESRGISERQQKRLWAIAYGRFQPKGQAHTWVRNLLECAGVSDTADLNPTQYQTICQVMEGKKPLPTVWQQKIGDLPVKGEPISDDDLPF